MWRNLITRRQKEIGHNSYVDTLIDGVKLNGRMVRRRRRKQIAEDVGIRSCIQ